MSTTGAAAPAASASGAATAYNGQRTTRRQQEEMDGSELPFLVTHWLRNFQASQGTAPEGSDSAASSGVSEEQRKAALGRIQRATSELASAFSALGVYGTASVPALTRNTAQNVGSKQETPTTRNATFSDLNRRWAGLPQNQLENMVGAAVSTMVAAEDVSSHCAESNLVFAADEAIHEQRRNPSAGRTVQDAIDLEKQDENELASVPVKLSILQKPAQVDFDFETGDNHRKGKVRSAADPLEVPPMESLTKQNEKKASQAMRQYLDLKEKAGSLASELQSLKSSLEKHSTTREELQERRANIGASMMQNPVLEQIAEEEQNARRVIAQLERKIGELEQTHAKTKSEMEIARTNAYAHSRNAQSSARAYRDPISDALRLRPSFGLNVTNNNQILRSLESMRVGLPINQTPIRPLVCIGPSQSTGKQRKSLVVSRMSHAVTINTHLSYPVYCLRFDKTGRYFVTGADDFLSRVFCLGAKQTTDVSGKGRLPQGHLETIRGAVLVCTLRGHAGVINDIDVSSDNCFLATASEDGDVRVWALKDGAPVAILRGHAGGANMVSWSQLTPYRLVTAGSDGFARTWDIREAALKRYNVAVGKRPEYALKLTDEEKESNSQLRRGAQEEERSSQNDNSLNLPPLPARQDATNQEGAAEAPLPDQPSPDQGAPLPDEGLPDQAPVPPLPLPPAAAAAAANAQGNNQNRDENGDIIEPGRFVANDTIDEGVKMVAKFQHGASLEERMAAPGTRSRRAAVNVLCVTRCPLGGHFATGASDGICRVWEDCDDVEVETVDKRFSSSAFELMGGDELSKERSRRKSSRTSSPNRLLLQLKGHLSAITDLQYSHAGDRIMTASQKDGTVRIWSWDVDPSIPDTYLQNNDRGLRNIVIKLTNPTSMSSDSRKSRRRAPSASSTASSESKTSCDVAAWAHDDTKIITSQSQQLRQTSSEIQPGSHFLFLWDSLAGHCLLGISGGHTMACPVVIPHPTDTSIFCSAGADGYVKVWDWESGKCLFSHKNTLEHGHIENPNDREKISGFLDGTFTPDGTGIVLTDDSGRVSIFDSIVPKSQQLASPENSVLPKPPFWMMEQYFSNDYYDLFYETNGYCVERGSQLPPHLAPHGVRCTHSGAPLPDNITDAFRKLTGPHPNPVQNCRWRRESIRCRAQRLQGSGRKVHSASSHQRGNIMQEFNALTTILISSTGETIKTRNAQGEIVSAPIPSASPAARRGAAGSASPVGTSPAVRTSSSGRQLSANYRWRDYEDMLQEERFLNDDDDDDEFQLPARRTSSRLNDSDDSDEDLENFSRRHGQSNRSGSQNHRQSTRRNATESSPEVRRSRSSNRRSTSGRNRRQYDEPDSDDEDVEEFVSTNNEPTGPFVADYNTHFFRLPANGPEISREWLTRIESDSGFSGRKIYAPQCGDSVIYIPRAHYETIEAFPTLEAPWMHWPNEAEWPIVNCRIRDIRYRFPFISYYGNRNVNRNACNSVVAILTLEVIGIPVLSQERVFHWPSPSFITPTRNHVFEVSMFESGQEEFLFPYDRFVYRIQCLEEAITLNGGAADGIELSTYYGDEENNVNDNDLVAYRGKLADYEQYDRELNDPNLNNSGFSALQVTWDDISQANDANDMSPWEVVVERPKSKKYSLSRTCLSDDESKQVREALKKLKRRPVVRELFLKEVDRRYSDYPLRVEVPMHLSLIQRRLDNNYYTSRWSVVADVRLIRDNCIKYNGEVGELSDAAREMYQEFEEAILSEEERNAYHNIGTTLQQPNARESSETRSSLENLPPPEDNSSRRRSLRIRIDTSQNRDQAEGRASGRPTRSNSALSNQQAAHSASFANASARGRQGRRQSNDSGTSDISGRQRRVPPRQSSRRGFTGNEGSANSLANASAPRPSRRSSRRDAYLDPEEDAEESNEAVSGRRTRSHGPAEELGIGESDYEAPARAKRDAESDSDTEHKIDQPGTQRQSRSRRPPQRFSEDDSAGESEQDTGPPTRKRKSRKDESEAEENEGSNSEDEFMEADKDQESEPEDEEGERKRNKKGSRNRNASLEAVNGRRASSRRSSQKVSYEEQSSSEFEEPMSEEDDYLAESTKTRRRSSPMRSPRKRKTPARTSRKRKAKSDYDEDSDEDEEEDEVVSPRLSKRRRSGSGRSPRKAKSEPWQEINVRRIPRVGKQILAFLRSMDEDELFAVPVVEALPELKREYLTAIEHPMDFRTIEEERLPNYSSVRELQDDLMLVFNNCIRFNTEDSPIGKFAMQMIGMLDDAFENAIS